MPVRDLAAALWDARWVIVFALVVFGANLLVSQMRGDAMIYAAVSQNLADGGHPLRLELAGEPYLNKPPLYFWMTATVMTLVGTGLAGVKLGALLASTGLCVLLYRGTRRIFDDRMAGMLAVFVFSATYVVYQNTYHARMESLLTLLVLGSLLCFWRWLESGRLPWVLGWGLLAGLAVLTKGPIGLLPVGAAILHLALADRSHVGARPALQLFAGLALCTLSFGWWVAAVAPEGEFVRVFLGEQILERSVFGPAREAHRWWSVYWAKLLSYDLPWMVLAGIGARRAWSQPRLRRPVGLLLTTAALHLVLIHLVEEKSARYLYQLYAFTSPLTAFGLLSLRRFDGEHLLKIVVVVFAIGLQFTGTSGGRDHFRPLLQARALSGTSGWALVADPQDFDRLDERAALDYYLHGLEPPPMLPESYLLVRPRGNPMPQARALFLSDRLWVGLVQGEHGPGPVHPMTSAEEGGP